MGALLDVWPLFGLRIVCPRLELRLPTPEEYAQLALLAGRVGVSDEQEWTFAHPWNRKQSPELERGMFQHYSRKLAEWGNNGKWCLMLGMFLDGQLIGMQDTFTRNPYIPAKSAETGSWIARSFQGQGFGKEARGAVLHLFFDHLDAVEMYSGAFLTNIASLAVSKYWGYEDNGMHLQTLDGCTDEARHIQGLRLTKKMWDKALHKSQYSYRVEGLAPCLSMFGLPPLLIIPPPSAEGC